MKPNEYPKILYKYRTWDNCLHKKIILDGEVYMSPPKDFNDPFDCRIPKNYYLINSPEKIHNYTDFVIDKYKTRIIESGRNVENEKKNLREKLSDIQKYQTHHENKEFSAFNDHYGVLSLSGRWDSILMWSHYGDFHKGFCIGFNELKMRHSGLFYKAGEVAYSEKFPELNPLNPYSELTTSFYQTYYKAKDWSYEEEYRFLNLYYPNVPTIQERKVKVPLEFIEEVNLGINISEKDRHEITSKCRESNIRIFQIEKVPFEFKLARAEML